MRNIDNKAKKNGEVKINGCSVKGSEKLTKANNKRQKEKAKTKDHTQKLTTTMNETSVKTQKHQKCFSCLLFIGFSHRQIWSNLFALTNRKDVPTFRENDPKIFYF